MPNRCSVFACMSNYKPDEHVPFFKLPMKSDELRHTWIRALGRDNLHYFKEVYVCVKHFREGDNEYTDKIPNGDGIFVKWQESTPAKNKVPFQLFYQDIHLSTHNLLPPKSGGACPSSLKMKNYSTKLRHLSSEREEKEKFKVNSFQDMQDKLSLLSITKYGHYGIPMNIWYNLYAPCLVEHNIIANTYLLVSFDLSFRAFNSGEILPHSFCSIGDIRQLESIVCEISRSPPPWKLPNESKTINGIYCKLSFI